MLLTWRASCALRDKSPPGARLEPVESAAHRGHRWPLLPSGPDGVRDSRLRGNWPSTPSHEEAMSPTSEALHQSPSERFGGDDRDRTGDLLVANEALSQLSYIPTEFRLLHNWRREWDSNPRSTFMLTRFPSVLLQPLGHLSGEASMFARSLTRRCLGWRRERDSNPRYAYAYSGFRDRPIQPLSHLSARENTRIAAAFPARKSLLSLDFARPGAHENPRDVPHAWPRLRVRKKDSRSAALSSARMPGRSSARWLSLRSWTTFASDPQAPALGSRAP